MANKTKKDLGITSHKRQVIDDETREKIIILHEKGVNKELIAQLLEMSISTVNAAIYINDLISEDRFDGAIEFAKSGNQNKVLNWALKRNGKELPKESTKEEEQVEAQKEGQKEEPTIDFGRIMYALGKIDERLEAITASLDNLGKWVTQFYEDFHEYHGDANVNADNLYRNITDAKGAITQAIKKMPKTYKGVE